MAASRPSKAMREVEDLEADCVSQAVTIDEAIAQFPGQWILMKVTAFDQHRIVSHGEILAHGSNREMSRALSKILPPPGSLSSPYYLFSASPRARNGTELRAALTGAAEEDGNGAWRQW
jgi:hypothetical protein